MAASRIDTGVKGEAGEENMVEIMPLTRPVPCNFVLRKISRGVRVWSCIVSSKCAVWRSVDRDPREVPRPQGR
jgi:hypothetical protein